MKPPRFLLNGYSVTRPTHEGNGIKSITIQAREAGPWKKRNRFSWYVSREWINPQGHGYAIKRCKSFVSAALRFALWIVEADYRTFRRRRNPCDRRATRRKPPER